MVRNIFILILFTVTLACGQTSKSQYTNLDAKIFQQQAAAQNIILLDVRTPEEYNSGHLKGAINYDYNGADFEKQISSIDKTKKVYVYCQRGGRSAGASEALSKNGFKSVFNLTGGIEAWQQNGLPVVK